MKRKGRTAGPATAQLGRLLAWIASSLTGGRGGETAAPLPPTQRRCLPQAATRLAALWCAGNLVGFLGDMERPITFVDATGAEVGTVLVDQASEYAMGACQRHWKEKKGPRVGATATACVRQVLPLRHSYEAGRFSPPGWELVMRCDGAASLQSG